jgi:hypothetical protein
MAQGIFNLKQVNQAIRQGAWSAFNPPQFVEYLVVAGGGGTGHYVGGGGAGGLLTGMVPVTIGTSYSVTVGAGGAASSTANVGNQGVSSAFGVISATGGGAGATPGGNGGSGGGSGQLGSATPNLGGQGVSGQGNAGGNYAYIGAGTSNYVGGGGGGGAGTAGQNGFKLRGGRGGAGIASDISGTLTLYAGGGGGSGYADGGPVLPGLGGVGGGGTGGYNTATAGAVNTGGGGGGGAAGYTGAAGGSGIVIVRYPGNIVFYTGGTVNYNNGYISHIFNSNGTLAPTTPTAYNTSYQISRSLRFNSADSAYLDRAQTTGDTQKATWSGWVKRSALTIGAYSTLFSAGTSNTDTLTWNNTGDTLRFFLNGASSADLVTTQVFRDSSAWYHIVIAIDTTQATAANRILMYINGVQVTAFTTATYPTQNYTFTRLNTSGYSANLGSIGTGSFLSAYMTEVNFIDGQQLTPSSFGATSTTTGVWSPIQYTGTYGTNGFYLNFSDNSNTTAATLGKDYSGNGNNWTPNNFSVTAGAGNDSVVDSPTQYGFDTGVGGTVRGNYCTLNPLNKGTNASSSNGNLTYSCGTNSAITGTFGITSGKWYWEVQNPTAKCVIGIVNSSATLNTYIGLNVNGWGYYGFNGQKFNNGGSAYGATFTTTDVIGIAFDADAGTLVFYKNNTSQGTAFTGLTSGPYFVAVSDDTTGGATGDFNFGQRPFAYTAPSGFKALCTQNLPTPTIGATSNSLATQFFAPVIYTGNGTSSARSITGVGFQPDFVWGKGRSVSSQHNLFDSVRGSGKRLISNSTAAEETNAAFGYLSSFDSDGFSTSAGSTNNENWNQTSATYVAWNWRAGNNAGASNSAGQITSTVSANTTSGFSIVTFTTDGTTKTVGHGLGVKPSLVIAKVRSTTGSWITMTDIINGSMQYSTLNSTAAFASIAYSAPTSSVFQYNDNNGNTQVAYCFAPVVGFSAFGTYAGNGSTDGTFVYLGFRPAYMMIKATNAADNWVIMDVARSPYNGVNFWLTAENQAAEATLVPPQFDFLSNGMKLRGTSSSSNGSGVTYIYMAFASNPFKYSLAR